MIYRFRIILNAQEDVFRDLEMDNNATLEDFHNSITQAFGFEGQEMASFYVSNDQWEQGEEFPLFDMSEVQGDIGVMRDTLLADVLDADQTKMIYVYDFLNYWTFLVELAEITTPQDGVTYPNLLFAHGQIPEEAPSTEFIGLAEDSEEDDDGFDEFGFDDDDLDGLSYDSEWQ